GRVGLRLAAAPAAAVVLAPPAAYVASPQQADGGFAEPGGRTDPALTAWSVLGLRAAGRQPGRSPVAYLQDAPVADTTDLALRVLALRAAGGDAAAFVERLERQRRPDGPLGLLEQRASA